MAYLPASVERALSAVVAAVNELLDAEQARRPAEEWMEELERTDWPSEAAGIDWRKVTIAAAARLAVTKDSSRETRRKGVFEECLNPDCGLPFDYREGRLIRLSSTDAKSPAEQPGVEHFWLCGKCSERYVFAHERGAGMRIKLRAAKCRETPARSLAATA
jgi:hypothetical protein